MFSLLLFHCQRNTDQQAQEYLMGIEEFAGVAVESLAAVFGIVIEHLQSRRHRHRKALGLLGNLTACHIGA